MSKFDNTHLSIDFVENTLLVHRDYIAHCHRWTFVCRWFHMSDRFFSEKGGRWNSAVLLDFGCGKDLPLFKALASNKFTQVKYYGVDINPLELPKGFEKRSMESHLMGETDFCSIKSEDVPGLNVITSFEVLEHVPAAYARQSIEHVYNLLPDNGYFIMSTPCFSEKVGAAKNHINEMTRDALGYLFEETGFTVAENYGTFASERDYKPHMTEAELEVFESLRPYYSNQYLATIMAPLYPQYSRNNLWVLRKKQECDIRQFPNKPENRHASGDDWEDLLRGL